MIMPFSVAGERDADFRIQAGAAVALQVFAGFEGKPVRASRGILRKIAAAAVGVGFTGGDRSPAPCVASVNFMPFEANGNSRSGLAAHRIQYMRSNDAHSTNHFPKRIWVIWRCCSAASRNSISRLLARRRFSIASISAVLLPVAHTM